MKSKDEVEVKLEAIKELLKLREEYLAQFSTAQVLIMECTPASIRKFSDIEYELTGDMKIAAELGVYLNMPDFMDCDCAEAWESLHGCCDDKVDMKHDPECQYYKENQ